MTRDGATRRPLTPLQFGMLYHYLREGRSSGADVVQVEVRLPADPGLERLADAWSVIVARHPSLRIAFDWKGADTPEAIVHPAVESPVERVDLRTKAPGPDAAFSEFLRRDRVRGFDLARPPAFRIALVELDGPEGEGTDLRLVWTLHHALADGASYALVLEELMTLLEGGELPPPVDPAPWHRWLAERDATGDEAFWRRALKGLPPALRLPRVRGPEGGSGGRWAFRRVGLESESLQALRGLAAREGVTLNTLLQGAWGLTLARLHDREEVVFGQVRGGRSGTVPDAGAMVDLFIRTVPVRVRVRQDQPLGAFFRELRDGWVGMRGHEHASPERLHGWSGAPAGELLFESVLNVQAPFWGDRLLEREGCFTPRGVDLHNPLVYPLTVAVNLAEEAAIRFEFDPDRLDAREVEAMLAAFEGHLHAFAEAAAGGEAAAVPLGELPWLAGEPRRRVIEDFNRTERPLPAVTTVQEAFAAQVARDPEAPALQAGGRRLSYGELDGMASCIAAGLQRRGIRQGDRVAVALERTPELVPALLGVAKAGAAWIPLDPAWPGERIRFMLEDAAPAAVLVGGESEGGAEPSAGDVAPKRIPVTELLAGDGGGALLTDTDPGGSDTAYILYTSGSTGKPKGVEVEHRNVLNFFAGMDERVGTGPGDRWLAVTSVSFDISVLELLWTLTRGAEVVLHGSTPEGGGGAPRGDGPAFSLFYFSAEGGEGEEPPAPGRDRYRLLLEGARFADEHGFAAVWTPERHFHPFGGIYPNPSVAGAAVAAITRRVRIRAGSVVLPLHDPIRVAEEWSVVDNLSDGRVDLAFASGWHDRDFIFAPERWEGRRSGLFDAIAELQRLWSGGTIEREGPEGRRHRVSLHPRPVQPELPVWITAGGSPDTFRRAGELGASLLTHLLGQRPEELARKIALYREARAEAGHEGPGHVSLMLHSWIGESEDDVRAHVRTPFRNYLRSSVGLLKAVAEGEGMSLGGADLSESEMEALLDHAFERYYRDSALMGTVERGVEIVRAMKDCGVDEIACLIDFGVEVDAVLDGLPRLREVMELAGAPAVDPARAPARIRSGRRASGREADPAVPALVSRAILEHGITHLQCTPSQAALILAEEEADEALGALRTLCVGGEAFPGALAGRLREHLADEARLLNMYGPTETTIWSAVHAVGSDEAGEPVVPLGQPIANTRLYVVDPRGEPVPPGVEGELLIGGLGVARGYHGRPELTAERFVKSPFSEGERLYRTGDRALRRPDGTVEFRGRVDEQIKLRGHRIEPGEIEAALVDHPAVERAVVVLRGEGPEARLVAFFSAAENLPGAGELRAHLAARLPAWMIPAGWEVVSAFPLTLNGKIDRRALAAGVAERRRLDAAEPAPGSVPATRVNGARVAGLERELRALWGELLEVEEVAPEANFFEIGGHSLLAVRMHSRLREEIVHGPAGRLSLVDLFRFPTVRALAGHLAALGADAGDGEAEADGVERARARGASRRAALRARAGDRRGGDER